MKIRKGFKPRLVNVPKKGFCKCVWEALNDPDFCIYIMDKNTTNIVAQKDLDGSCKVWMGFLFEDE